MSRQVIDSHQHSWDIQRLQYWWLTPARMVLNRNFLSDNLRRLVHESGVDRTVIVQANPSVQETEWLLDLAGANDFIGGVVGWVDMTSPNLGTDLDLLQKRSKFKEIRHPIEAESNDAWMLRTDVVSRPAQLGCRGYDIEIWPCHLKYFPGLREKCPRVRLVHDHIGLPSIAERETDGWDWNMVRVAGLPDMFCKLAGLITRARPNWTREDLKPYVEHVVELFGYDRLMFGSDWPVGLMAVSYPDVVDAVREVLGPLRRRCRQGKGRNRARVLPAWLRTCSRAGAFRGYH